MDDTAFDTALVRAGFALAGEQGWPRVSVTAAARAAGLPLDRARGRFMGRASILARFGRLADQHALAHAVAEGGQRDRLFDLVMSRLEFVQSHRDGVLALKTYLPREPRLAAMLWLATLGSMAWLLEAAGIPAQGCRGGLRVQGLGLVWLSTLRAWEGDASDDLASSMAALDKALDRAVRAEAWLPGGRDRAPGASPEPPPPPPGPPGPPAAPAAEAGPNGGPLPPPIPGYEPPLPPP